MRDQDISQVGEMPQGLFKLSRHRSGQRRKPQRLHTGEEATPPKGKDPLGGVGGAASSLGGELGNVSPWQQTQTKIRRFEQFGGGTMARGRKPIRPCGTIAALRRHYKRNEPVCDACAEARRKQTAADYAKRSGRWAPSSGPDRREIRNGLPEFVPYIYRGTG